MLPRTMTQHREEGPDAKRGAAEFDQYVAGYRDIINKNAAIVGESFEYFIDLRLDLLQAAARRAMPPARVLDFGCGMGATQQAMRRRWPDAELHGIDPSPESIRAAEELGLANASFRVSSGYTLPYDAGTFDLVYSNGTFHHIDHAEHPAVFREIARVLRPGGNAFIFENNPYNPVSVIVMRRTPIDANTKMLFPPYLARLQRRAGLRVEAVRYYVFFPKPLKFLRPAEKYLMRVPMGAQ